MQINKFKYKPDEVYPVEIEYTINHDKSDKKSLINVKLKEELLDDHSKKLQELSSHVVDICELQKNATIKITGLSFSWAKNVMGCVIIAQMTLSKSTGVVNLVTPHRIKEFYAENGDSGQLMPYGMSNSLEDILENIRLYFKGERKFAQEELEL